MEFSSADFMRLTVQELVDFLLDNDSNGAVCKGMVDGRLCSLKVELVLDE